MTEGRTTSSRPAKLPGCPPGRKANFLTGTRSPAPLSLPHDCDCGHALWLTFYTGPNCAAFASFQLHLALRPLLRAYDLSLGITAPGGPLASHPPTDQGFCGPAVESYSVYAQMNPKHLFTLFSSTMDNLKAELCLPHTTIFLGPVTVGLNDCAEGRQRPRMGGQGAFSGRSERTGQGEEKGRADLHGLIFERPLEASEAWVGLPLTV